MKEKEYLLDSKDDKNKLSDFDITGQSGKRIRALQMDVDRLTKEIRKKEKYEKKLNATINEITDKLVRLEQMKGLTNEDIKLANLTSKQTDKADVVTGDAAKIDELDKMLKAKENRLLMISQKSKNQETELNQAKAELLKLKESEKGLKEEVKNLLSGKQKLIDDFQKERRELKKLEREAKKLADIGGEQAAGANLELKVQIKQLEKELTILKSQARPVVAYNNENKSFEYIGDPLSLHVNGEPCDNIEEFLYLAKEWLKVNNRITVRSIFNSFDYSKSGYLDKDLFAPIFSRIGIKLHKNEVEILFNWLKDNEEYQWKYKPLVIELTTGPSQIEFIPHSTLEISKLVLDKDYDYFTILSEIDKEKHGNITKENLSKGIEVLFPKAVKTEIIEDLYKIYKYKGEDRADPEKFTTSVLNGALALSIKSIKEVIEERSREYARDAREGKLEETKGIFLDNEFSKIDREHDGILTYEQFRKLLDVYALKDLKDNAIKNLIELLDYSKKGGISLPYIKQVFDLPRSQSSGEDDIFALDMKPTKDSFREREDFEIEDNARKAIRRIYQKNNLIDRLGKQLKQYDYDKDQVMSRSILKQAIIDVTKDVHEDDVNYIVQFADKRNKGYFSPELFMENITKIAQDEAKCDSILRRVGNVVKHKGVDLEKELNKQTKNNSGVIDTFDFMRAIRDMRIGLDGNDMDDLVRYACNGEKYIDIKLF